MTIENGKPYVVRQTRSVVKPGTFGGNHPKHSAIRDHCDTIGDLIRELEKDHTIGYSEASRIRALVREVSDWAFEPINADLDRAVKEFKEWEAKQAEREARKKETAS